MWRVIHFGNIPQKVLAAIITNMLVLGTRRQITFLIKTLEEDGACLAKCVMEKYKELITSKYDVHDSSSEFTNYKKILKMVVEAKGCMCYCPSKKSGIMYYNPSMLSDKTCYIGIQDTK